MSSRPLDIRIEIKISVILKKRTIKRLERLRRLKKVIVLKDYRD